MVVAVALGVGTLAAGGAAPAGAQTGTGTITGSLPSTFPGPLVWCVVAVGEPGTHQTTADVVGGGFSLEVPPGTYFVWFIPCGRLSGLGPAVQLYFSASSYDAATPVVVNEGVTTPLQHQPAAPPGAVIAGQVLDADSRTVADCDVQVITRTPIPTLVGGVRTDIAGAYRITNLPAGSMDVVVYCGTGFVTTYHGDATDPSASVPVTTTAGTIVDGVDITVARTGASVAGRVTVTDTRPVLGACVFAYSSDGAALGASELRTDGAWAITNLPVGDVRIGFHPCHQPPGYVAEWYNDTEDFAAATPVPVNADSATTGIDAVLARTGRINVRVMHPDGTLVAGVCVWLTDATGTSLITVKYGGGGAHVELDGVRAGTYSALFTDCGSNGFPPEWYQDAPDHATSTPITVSEGETTFLDVTLG